MRGVRSQRDVEDRLVFISGGASGIGFGLARAFAAERARIAIADVCEARLAEGVAILREHDADVMGIPLDVRDTDAWTVALDQAEARFGPLAVLCSNAGVAGSRLNLEDTEPAAWRWTFDVNVAGALNAIRAGAPRMRACGLPGHILLTASMGAFLVRPANGIYSASKAALVALAQALHGELEGTSLGVSVLCPGLVATRLVHDNSAHAPEGVALGHHEPELERAMKGAIDPHELARAVIAGIYEGRFWLFTHPELRGELRARLMEICEDY